MSAKTSTQKKRLLSGVQPSGRLHVGNYFGAIKQFVALQDEYETFVFVADYHALTTTQNPEQMRGNIYNTVIDYLALGLDPERTLLYKQSEIGEHTELAWIFNCITTVSYLQRGHAYKDAQAKGEEVNVGTFDYPMLMAADILMYDADVVPVGADQKQHIEFARDTAEKFNNTFGEAFTVPDGLIMDDVATVPGIDGRKMSKSYGNTIPLFATDEEIAKAVMSIATDSKGVEEPKDPDESNLFAIHKLFLDEAGVQELRAKYEQGGAGYKDLKEQLIADVQQFIRPLREKRAELEADTDYVRRVIIEGSENAKARAAAKMEEVRKKVGVAI